MDFIVYVDTDSIKCHQNGFHGGQFLGGNMGKWILTVVWNDGSKEFHKFLTQEAAEQAEEVYKMSFGNQCWTGVHYRWND